jgi:hypothetical protein
MYVDGLVVINKKKEDHPADPIETFATKRESKLRLNPNKCIFGVHKGKGLGYLVSHRGIEANLNKNKQHRT